MFIPTPVQLRLLNLFATFLNKKRVCLLMSLLGLVVSLPSQTCVYEFSNPDSNPIFCLKNGLESGDVVQLSCADFYGADLIDQFIEFQGDWCDENARIKVVRRIKDRSPISATRSSNTTCIREIEFGGDGFDSQTSEDAPCRQTLTLFIQIDENINNVTITPPPPVSVTCGYDLQNDPLDLIETPTSDSGGTFSFTDDITPTNCEGTTTVQRTWTWTSCCESTINTQQTITVLPADCSATTPLTLNYNLIPQGSFYGAPSISATGIITDLGPIFLAGIYEQPQSVQFYATEQITLQPGFQVEAGNDFLAKITDCNINPVNNFCATSTMLTCGETIIGNTITTTNADVSSLDGSCFGSGLDKGVFFHYIGTGTMVTISTDHPATNFDTELRLYKGDCSANTCLLVNDDVISGNTNSILEFYAEADTTYLIYLDGYNGANGSFDLSVTCSLPIEGVLNCGSDLAFTGNNFSSNWVGDVLCYIEELENEYSVYYTADFYYIKVTESASYDFKVTTFPSPYTSDPRSQSLAVLSINDHYEWTDCITYHPSGFDYTWGAYLVPGDYMVAISTNDKRDELRHYYDLSVTCFNDFSESESEKRIPQKTGLPEELPMSFENNATADSDSWSIQLFPNPSSGRTQLSYTLPETMPLTISLLDITGKFLRTIIDTPLQEKGKYEQAVDFSAYLPGIYILKVQGHGMEESQKVIIQ